MRRYLPITLSILLILTTLACNLPSSSKTPRPGLFQAAQQTLTAQAALTQPAGVTPQPPVIVLPPELTPIPMDSPTPNPGVFQGLHTPQPGTWPPASSDPGEIITYILQPGDTRQALAARFNTWPPEFDILPDGLLPAGGKLQIPNTLGETLYGDALLPDSEIVYSPTSAGFNIAETIQSAGGYLGSYSETVDGETLTGTQIVERLALDTSINPRLLLAVIEYQSGWLKGPQGNVDLQYPLGFRASDMKGLYKELTLVCRFLTQGYYGWRDGSRVIISFKNSGSVRLTPSLNAGTVALMNMFSVLMSRDNFENALYKPGGFLELYTQLFGDPWARAANHEPFFPQNLSQPSWQLPYPEGQSWHFTSGPHISWGIYSPRGALDFAPPAPDGMNCQAAAAWVTASAPGLVVRSERGQVLVDLDSDGYEQSGWVMLYMHIAAAGRIPVGTQLNVNDPIGHPSCEGGRATGTHVHIARKYNGEWIAANSALDFDLSGWEITTGDPPYKGSLTRGGVTVNSSYSGSGSSLVKR